MEQKIDRFLMVFGQNDVCEIRNLENVIHERALYMNVNHCNDRMQGRHGESKELGF